MKERILIVGFGACGSNIAYEFDKIGYNTACINTSNADLESVGCKVKYHIPASFGCNQDIDKAVNYAEEYWDHMVNFINRNYPRTDLIFFASSTSGGTGAGIMPIMLDIMSDRDNKKTYGAITVLPSVNEIPIALENSKRSYRQLTNVINAKNLYVLDNNNTDDKFSLNSQIARKFDYVINMTNPDARGVVDEAEIDSIFKTKGSAIIEEWIYTQSGYKTFKNCIFTPYSANASKIAFTTQKPVNFNEFQYKVGNPIHQYYGYNAETNLFIAAGIPYSDIRIKEYQDKLDSVKINNTVKGLDYDVKLKFNHNVSSSNSTVGSVKVDFSKYR